MKNFSILCSKLNENSSSKAKVNNLIHYLNCSDSVDASWALFFLLSYRNKRILRIKEINDLVKKLTNFPEWLLKECSSHVSDSIESATLIISKKYLSRTCELPTLAKFLEGELFLISNLSLEDKLSRIIDIWQLCDFNSCLIVNKIMTNTLRISITPQDIIKAIAQFSKLPEVTIATRLSKGWEPNSEYFKALLSDHSEVEMESLKPLSLQKEIQTYNLPAEIGNSSSYIAEIRLEGIRSQLINTSFGTQLWTEDHKNITQYFPEVIEAASKYIPLNTILVGQLIAIKNNRLLPFAQLKKRLDRKQPSNKLKLEIPINFLASDILYNQGTDIRNLVLTDRKNILADIFCENDLQSLKLVEDLKFSSWDELNNKRLEAKHKKALGIAVKSANNSFINNTDPGNYILWKTEQYKIYAALIYIQKEKPGKDKNIAQLTFAALQENELVSIVKLACELDKEIESNILSFAKQNSLESFGPIIRLKPEMIFELSFDSIAESSRNKSGITLKECRVTSYSQKETIKDVVNLAYLKSLNRTT